MNILNPLRTRRRIAALALSLAAAGGMGVALAPGAAAGAVYSAGTNCIFSTSHYSPIRVWWERSSGGGSRHGYKAAFGDAAGSNNDEEIGSLNFWQSYKAFGPAVNGSYVVYFSGGTYSYITPAQPSTRMPYIANATELHLDLELVTRSGIKCRREWRVYTTGATRDG